MKITHRFTGSYPTVFNRCNLTSEPVEGIVYFIEAYPDYFGAFPTDTYNIGVSFIKEEITVESRTNTVIQSDGTTLTSLNPGFEVWRADHRGFWSARNQAAVAYDFTGSWYAQSSPETRLSIPRVPNMILYGNDWLDLDLYYKSTPPFVSGYFQRNDGVAQIINPISGQPELVTCSIGPYWKCLCLESDSWLLQPNDHIGGLAIGLIGKGNIRYVGDDEFDYWQLNSTRSQRFVRGGRFTIAITSAFPMVGRQGSIITIRGISFTGATGVTFGGTPASSFTVLNDSTIQAVVGTGQTGDICVITPHGTSCLPGYENLDGSQGNPCFNLKCMSSKESGLFVREGFCDLS